MVQTGGTPARKNRRHTGPRLTRKVRRKNERENRTLSLALPQISASEYQDLQPAKATGENARIRSFHRNLDTNHADGKTLSQYVSIGITLHNDPSVTVDEVNLIHEPALPVSHTNKEDGIDIGFIDKKVTHINCAVPLEDNHDDCSIPSLLTCESNIDEVNTPNQTPRHIINSKGQCTGAASFTVLKKPDCLYIAHEKDTQSQDGEISIPNTEEEDTYPAICSSVSDWQTKYVTVDEVNLIHEPALPVSHTNKEGGIDIGFIDKEVTHINCAVPLEDNHGDCSIPSLLTCESNVDEVNTTNQTPRHIIHSKGQCTGAASFTVLKEPECLYIAHEKDTQSQDGEVSIPNTEEEDTYTAICSSVSDWQTKWRLMFNDIIDSISQDFFRTEDVPINDDIPCDPSASNELANEDGHISTLGKSQANVLKEIKAKQDMLFDCRIQRNSQNVDVTQQGNIQDNKESTNVAVDDGTLRLSVDDSYDCITQRVTESDLNLEVPLPIIIDLRCISYISDSSKDKSHALSECSSSSGTKVNNEVLNDDENGTPVDKADYTTSVSGDDESYSNYLEEVNFLQTHWDQATASDDQTVYWSWDEEKACSSGPNKTPSDNTNEDIGAAEVIDDHVTVLDNTFLDKPILHGRHTENVSQETSIASNLRLDTSIMDNTTSQIESKPEKIQNIETHNEDGTSLKATLDSSEFPGTSDGCKTGREETTYDKLQPSSALACLLGKYGNQDVVPTTLTTDGVRTYIQHMMERLSKSKERAGPADLGLYQHYWSYLFAPGLDMDRLCWMATHQEGGCALSVMPTRAGKSRRTARVRRNEQM